MQQKNWSVRGRRRVGGFEKLLIVAFGLYISAILFFFVLWHVTNDNNDSNNLIKEEEGIAIPFKNNAKVKHDDDLRNNNSSASIAVDLPKEITDDLIELNENIMVNLNKEFVDESNFTALWLGDVALDRQDSQISTKSYAFKISLVISHCDKPVDWIWKRFLPHTDDIKVTPVKNEDILIYSKCNKPVIGAPSDVKIITSLPNVGRCDHTYAFRLCQITSQKEYDLSNNFASDDNDVIIFLKDNAQREEWYTRRSFDHLMRIVSRNGFACIEQELQFKTLYPSFYHDFKTWKTFKNKGGYAREKNRDTTESFVSEYNDLWGWIEALNLTSSVPHTLGKFGVY